jgi:hypothetical protein
MFSTLVDRIKKYLRSTPPSAQAAYIMKCLKFSAFVYGPSAETLNKLFIEVLRRLKASISEPWKDGDYGRTELERSFDGDSEAKRLASQLVSSIILRSIDLSEFIDTNDSFLVTLTGLFLIETGHLKEATLDADKFEELERGTEQIIWRLASCRQQKKTKAMLERFPLKDSTSRNFLASMVIENQLEAAEDLATLLGQTMLKFLVELCTDKKNVNMRRLKVAKRIVDNHKLDFPNVCIQFNELSLIDDVEKANLKKARLRAGKDSKLVERLEERASEMGYVEKEAVSDTDYLRLEDFVSKDNVVWIDTRDGLQDATRQFAGVEMVGIDSEFMFTNWKEDGPDKMTSILQIATEKNVLIFDMLKLYNTESEALNDCLKPVFLSRDILKLGYDLNSDLHLLFRCYGDLECFRRYEGTLDLQKLFARIKGGLSGLANAILGAHLNKTKQMTDWAERPLDISQLQYAAIDATVLISIFNKTCNKTDQTDDWKSHINCWEPSKKDHKLREKYQNVILSILKELADNQVDSIQGTSEAMVLFGSDSKFEE